MFALAVLLVDNSSGPWAGLVTHIMVDVRLDPRAAYHSLQPPATNGIVEANNLAALPVVGLFFMGDRGSWKHPTNNQSKNPNAGPTKNSPKCAAKPANTSNPTSGIGQCRPPMIPTIWRSREWHNLQPLLTALLTQP